MEKNHIKDIQNNSSCMKETGQNILHNCESEKYDFSTKHRKPALHNYRADLQYSPNLDRENWGYYLSMILVVSAITENRYPDLNNFSAYNIRKLINSPH
jgi:hypothetical protein